MQNLYHQASQRLVALLKRSHFRASWDSGLPEAAGSDESHDAAAQGEGDCRGIGEARRQDEAGSQGESDSCPACHGEPGGKLATFFLCELRRSHGVHGRPDGCPAKTIKGGRRDH